MVEPLPVGVCLTAIFDSCHSGTLLDLDHYRCNEVKFDFSKRAILNCTLKRASIRTSRLFLVF